MSGASLPVAAVARLQDWTPPWRRPEDPVALAEHLRVVYQDHVFNSPIAILISLYLCLSRPNAARSLAVPCVRFRSLELNFLICDFHLGDEKPGGLMPIQAVRDLQPQHRAPLSAWLMTCDVSGTLENAGSANGVGILHKPVRPALLRDRLLGMLHPASSHALETHVS